MAAPTTKLAQAILQEADAEKRVESLQSTHALVAEFSSAWHLLEDAYEGDGGFLSGAYLDRFPAELDGDFKERQDSARYHNFVESLIDIYVRHVCSRGVSRQTTNTELNEWWSDVDGAGTKMQDFVRDIAAQGLSQGHCAALVDKTPDEPTGPAQADERARVILTRFMSTSVLDWRLNKGELTAVKLLEAAPEPDITESIADAPQYALWNKTEFARFDAAGELLTDGEHNLGLVPVAVLRPKPSKKHAFIGRPLVRHDVVRALYNRASEEDHVIRHQGFSLLTVSVPHDAPNEAVQQTQDAVEANYGVKRALVVRGTVAYVSPDMSIPTTIRDNMQFLIRELYRAAHVVYQNDSREAEAAESIRLKNTELNEMLRALAQALTAFELRVARIWCAWKSATAEAGAQLFENANVSVQYPDEFMTRELIEDLKAWGEAVRFGLPDQMVKRIKKRAVRRIEPDIPEDVAAKIDKLIDAMPETPAGGGIGDPARTTDDIRARAAARLAQFGQKQEGGEAA